MSDVMVPPTIDPRLAQRRALVLAAIEARRRRWLYGGLGALTAFGLAFAATFSPLLDVDEIVVAGADRTGADVVAAHAGVRPGDPLVWVDAGDVVAEVEALPWVADVSFRRHYSGRVELRVTERIPVGAVAGATGGWRLVDRAGRVLETVDAPPAGVLPIVGVAPAGEPGASLVDGHGALILAGAVPAAVRERLALVRVEPDGELRLIVIGGGIIRIGDTTDLASKLVSVGTILDAADTLPTGVLDVRVPEHPVLTGATT